MRQGYSIQLILSTIQRTQSDSTANITKLAQISSEFWNQIGNIIYKFDIADKNRCKENTDYDAYFVLISFSSSSAADILRKSLLVLLSSPGLLKSEQMKLNLKMNLFCIMFNKLCGVALLKNWKSCGCPTLMQQPLLLGLVIFLLLR